jgi:L-ascorbate metabolism protein UlaG (beta-lactamase superfamily)
MSITIEHYPAGESLAAAVNDARFAVGEVACWWLGQAGFALRYQDTLLLIDPYLSDSLAEKYRNSELKHMRMMPPPLSPTAVRGCAWYLCTHGHTDHMDAQTIEAVLEENSPLFLIPRSEQERGKQRGIPLHSMRTINAGETASLGKGIEVEAIAAAHEEFETDESGDHKFLGYILAFGDIRIYHSGDSVPYAGLAALLRAKNIDVAFLPINGRDEFRRSRGVPGNFTLEEAIDLCQDAHIPCLLGHHFGMFDFNTIDPAEATLILDRCAASLQWVLPQTGHTYVLAQR